MKIKNGILMNDNFLNSLQKLISIEMPAKQCLQLSAAIEKIESQIKILQRSKYSIIDKMAEKTSEGKIATDARGEAQFKNDEIKIKCSSQVAEIMNEDFEVSLKEKVVIAEDNSKFNTQDIMLLRDLIEIK